MWAMRVYNFSAGPAMLPTDVLEAAASELTDWQGSGMSVMEVSHRGKDFVAAAAETESLLREVHGGARRTTRCCSCRAAPPASSTRSR